MSKPKKIKVGRVGKAPTLKRIEILTQGLMRDPDEVKASFSIKEDDKGRGVYLKIPELPKGAFVLEYEGDIINPEEVKRRERVYNSNGEGCFIMEFKFKGKKMAIDATRNFESYTRLLNHSMEPNIKFHPPIIVNLTGPPKPRIAAYALRDIKRGEEIVIDYGVKDSRIPWLKNRKIGYADVSDDEVDDEDDADEDKESCSSDENYLCLRYTAARAGRLDGSSDKSAFNYREYSRSRSSSSSGSQKESSQRRTSKQSWKGSSKSKSVSDGQSTSTSYKNSFHCSTRECRWDLKPVGKRKFQVTISCMSQPQKILKCFEPKHKRRKTEGSNSIICLSDESSPSPESISDSDPNEILNIPEVSSETKVLDWQKSMCSDDTDCTIKIVGVQSLCDSPEHVPDSEPSYQIEKIVSSQVCQPVVSLERIDPFAALSKTGSHPEFVSPHQSSSSHFSVSQEQNCHINTFTRLNNSHHDNHVPENRQKLSAKTESHPEVVLPHPPSSSHFSVSQEQNCHINTFTRLNSSHHDNHVPENRQKLSAKTESHPEVVSPHPPSSSHFSVSQEQNCHINTFSQLKNPHQDNPVPENRQKLLARTESHPKLASSHQSSSSHFSVSLHENRHVSTLTPPNNLCHASENSKLKAKTGSQPKLASPHLTSSNDFSVSQQQNSDKNILTGSNNLCRTSHRPKNGHKPLASHTLSDSLVISDEEDDMHVKKENNGESSRTANSIVQSQQQRQTILVASSGDDSDVEEISQSNAHSQSAMSQIQLNQSTAKFSSIVSNQNTSTRSKVDDFGCEVIRVENARPNASTAKMVAVVQPFNECSLQTSSILTYSERDHLCRIFDRSSFSRNVSKQDINDKIYHHWNFFRSILQRGVSIEQIRSAVKQTCLDKYKRHRKRRSNAPTTTADL